MFARLSLGIIVMTFWNLTAAEAKLPRPAVQTSRALQSAPLNFVKRSFTRIEIMLGYGTTTKSFSFKANLRPESTVDIDFLRNMIVHQLGSESVLVDGPDALQVTETINGNEFISPSKVESVIEGFLHGLATLADENPALDGFSSSLRAALARSDIKIYSLRVFGGGSNANILMLVDGETQEALVLGLPKI